MQTRKKNYLIYLLCHPPRLCRVTLLEILYYYKHLEQRLKDFPRSQFIFVFREILKEVKQSGEIHLVLDCDFEKVG